MTDSTVFSDPLMQRTASRLAPLLPPQARVLLGLSGGVDSVVLLHLLHSLAPHLNFRFSALHVHHGISPYADAWAQFCTELCREYRIPLHLEPVDITALRAAHGIEAAARKLRHAALARQGCDAIALAHHADDQAETLLLQLLRGTGVRGAAAMPFARVQEGRIWLRPLLDSSRAELLEYARAQGLQWIEDESNADERFPRNFLRHRLLPLLEQRFPAWRRTLGRSARHFAEASELLDEIARADAPASGRLDVATMRALTPPRAKNLLRHFLHEQGAPMPQATQLDDLLHQLCNAREGAAVCVNFGGWQVRRYQGEVYAGPVLPACDPALQRVWQGELRLYWPPQGREVSFTPTVGQGISRVRLERGEVSLRLRRGGETLRPRPRAARRSLKNLLQEHQVPPWQRESLPLLYCGEALVCVVGVAVAAEFQADRDEPSVMVA